MYVKGVAFLARQAMVVADHGQERWNQFLAAYSERVPLFAGRVLPVSRIPAELFLTLNDDIVRTFYGNDALAFWHFGERAGHQALDSGQLRLCFAPGDYQRFLLFSPRIWSSYFDLGHLDAHRGDGWVELLLRDIPFRHRYFEEVVMGFFLGGLKALGLREPHYDVMQSTLEGDPDVLYRFHLW